ncbi:AAA domain-containing protein [Nitrospira sp. Nam74]
MSRVTEQDVPAVPEMCVPWLDGVDVTSLDTEPSLNVTRIETSQTGKETLIEPTDKVHEQWAAYIVEKWRPWAERMTLARRTRASYQKLFAAYQERLGRDDAYDLFIGVGLLHSRNDRDQPIRRHLIAFPAELQFDSKTGTLTVLPALDFDQARVELDFLPPSQRAVLTRKIDDLLPAIRQVGPVIQDRPTLGTIVASLVHCLDSDSSYVDELLPQDANQGQIRASFAPAIIMRPRGTRSIDALLEQIDGDVSGENARVSNEETSIPWRRLIEDERAWRNNSEEHNSAPQSRELERVFFPLPSNEEQSRIVKYATGTAGVVVQGPPGTGKSHTIANLISHYLATGKRVLVTAQTAQALQVLRDKLPKDLQTLCVSLLGTGNASDKELRRSVNGILARRQEIEHPAAYEREAARLEVRLVESETKLLSLERLLRDARAAETETLEPASGYRGTRAAIARRLKEEESAIGWIRDEISYDQPCPTCELGWTGLADYHASLAEEVRQARGKIVLDLPFDGLEGVHVLERINDLKIKVTEKYLSSIPTIPEGVDHTALTELLAWLESLLTLETGGSPDDSVWISELRTGVLRNDLASWQALRSEAAGKLNALSDGVVSRMKKVDVVQRSCSEARQALKRLSDHYGSGGGRRVLGVFKPAVVKDTEWVEQSVRLDGAPVRTPDEIDDALQALEGMASLDGAWDVWNRWPAHRGGSPRQQVATLANRLKTLDAFLILGASRDRLILIVRQWLTSVAVTKSSTEEAVRDCQRRLAEVLLQNAQAERDRMLSSLSIVIGRLDVVPPILHFREAMLCETPKLAHEALAALSEEQKQNAVHRQYVTFLKELSKLAPSLAAQIAVDEGSNKWTAHFSNFPKAWVHRCVSTWLATVLQKDRIEITDRAARDERSRAHDLLRDLTIARAWHAALQRIDDSTRASLRAWTQAVADIPASGPSIFRRRAVARSFLPKCLDAIPAWVVSLGRLYETVDARPGMFDIAIVDEASQCWLDSLVLFYLAKQIIVVGDDKQISPTVVGVKDGEIDALAQSYISDFKYRGNFTIQSSLFDHALRYLPAGVPLQEHFRCVPEIIRFSNELCYAEKPLIPLRQCGKERLQPLKTTYLPNGLRHGDINDIEARAIVDAIAHCHTDEAYEEGEFGVICLQGDDQALHIQQLLLERLGPGVFEKRNLRCGNPYAFQGDERDVIFLSMVAGPNTTNATLTTRMYEQRFNVALSRAKDQLWLFHSVREQDVSPKCLRRRVLEFFYQPTDLSIRGSALNIPHLRLLALRADRQREGPPSPFESWFELDVALALSGHGLAVSAQIQVAKRRIDLVIEGDGTRLAVECDGEAWHGPDRFAEDLFRQRQLERAGWRFARIRESMFYSNQDHAIAEIIAAWEELNVECETSTARKGPTPHYNGETTSAEPATSTRQNLSVQTAVLKSTGLSDDSGDERGEPEDVTDQLAEVALSTERDGPFTGYASKDYPDPRVAPPSNIREAVLDIVKSDGPLPKASIYALYRDGCPRIERARKSLKQAVNRALAGLERAHMLESRDEGGRRDPADVVVKLPSQPWIDSRVLGRRGLNDVPLSELAVVMKAINGHSPPTVETSKQILFRALARRFKVQRLTAQWIPRLEKALLIAFDDDSSNHKHSVLS